jgi:hypothetical protein
VGYGYEREPCDIASAEATFTGGNRLTEHAGELARQLPILGPQRLRRHTTTLARSTVHPPYVVGDLRKAMQIAGVRA